MPRRKSRTLTEVELEIMQVIWQRGEASVQEIQEALTKPAGAPALPTVRKMLSILQEKGYVARRAEGRGHLYRAKVPRDEAQEKILRDVVKRAFKGSAARLVAALVATDMLSENELARAYSGMGRYHKQQGNVEEAREYLTKALEIFERLGTLIEPDTVREELADLA